MKLVAEISYVIHGSAILTKPMMDIKSVGETNISGIEVLIIEIANCRIT